jgi:hypothetical protein
VQGVNARVAVDLQRPVDSQEDLALLIAFERVDAGHFHIAGRHADVALAGKGAEVQS